MTSGGVRDPEVRRTQMGLSRNSTVHKRLHAAKDGILETVNKALRDAGLHGFSVGSIGLYYKRPAKQCGPDEDLVWEPIETGEDETVVYGWVCKPRK